MIIVNGDNIHGNSVNKRGKWCRMIKRRILVAEFHQETNSFNPIITDFDRFQADRSWEGGELLDKSRGIACTLRGMFDAIGEFGGEVIPTVAFSAQHGGNVRQDVLDYLLRRFKKYADQSERYDAVFISLHGATASTQWQDACGMLLQEIRNYVGKEKVIAASCDLHANCTERMLTNADVICGYQTYPHMDQYETGYRAARFGMMKLLGKSSVHVAAAFVPMIVPAAGYSTLEGPFGEIIAYGKKLVAAGELLDFSVFQMQPWLDVSEGASATLAIAGDEGAAKKHALALAEMLYERRNFFWPKLFSIDEIIDAAEKNHSGKPVILCDSADSPNGGAVGDSAVVIQKLLERGSQLRMAAFVTDKAAVDKAFQVGVGNRAVFTFGASIMPEMYGPVTTEAKVRSLHDGDFTLEGPASFGLKQNIGQAAVISVGRIDVLLCEYPTATGDPQLFRHFGIEPSFYDLVVVKANTSFRVPYSSIAEAVYHADTPGSGAVNLKKLPFHYLPKDFYPFGTLDGYHIEPPRCFL